MRQFPLSNQLAVKISKYSIILIFLVYFRHLNQIRNFIKIPPIVFMPIANGIFIFNPPPRHFGWLVFAFLALYRPTDYVYKIWLSLLQGQEFTSPPPFGWFLWGIFLNKSCQKSHPLQLCSSDNLL